MVKALKNPFNPPAPPKMTLISGPEDRRLFCSLCTPPHFLAPPKETDSVSHSQPPLTLLSFHAMNHTRL